MITTISGRGGFFQYQDAIVIKDAIGGLLVLRVNGQNQPMDMIDYVPPGNWDTATIQDMAGAFHNIDIQANA